MLRPGDAHFYDVHVIHSPKRDTVTKLVRIEGSNLDHIKRSNIKAAAKVGLSGVRRSSSSIAAPCGLSRPQKARLTKLPLGANDQRA